MLPRLATDKSAQANLRGALGEGRLEWTHEDKGRAAETQKASRLSPGSVNGRFKNG